MATEDVRAGGVDLFDITPPRGIVVLTYQLVPRMPPDLTGVEQEIVLQLLEGRSNSEIAASRERAVNTITNQVAEIFRKLRVNTRAELAVKLSASCAECTLSSCQDCPFDCP